MISAETPFLNGRCLSCLLNLPGKQICGMGMKDQKRLEQFKRIVDSLVTVPKSEWEFFIQHLSERTFEKNEYLVRAGDVVKMIVCHWF